MAKQPKTQVNKPVVEQEQLPAKEVVEQQLEEQPVVQEQSEAVEQTATNPEAVVVEGESTQVVEQELSGSVEPEQPPVLEPVLAQEPTVEPIVETPVSTAPDLSTYSPLFQIAASDLDTYVKNMARNVPQTATSGAMYQVGLYRTFQKFLALEAQEFKVGMDLLLSVIYQNRDDVFNDSNPFRFSESVTLRETDRKLFNRLLNLFIVASAPATRKAAIERVNLQETIKLLPSETCKQLLIAYFA